ncbi:MAG: hypothetical protein ABWY38_04380 [Methyloceanibacter sp.]
MAISSTCRPKRRLKDIERKIRRLSKLGNLHFERSRDPVHHRPAP